MSGLNPTDGPLASSFRDPSGCVFRRKGVIYRQVNAAYARSYDHLLDSGLYDELVSRGILIPHEEVSLESALSREAYKVLRPTEIPFTSYPYEWCFSQLKAAALATLEIQRTALRFGMTLKDASAYNIQFLGANPVLIDTLSFEPWCKERPWVAYRQFCEHFLAPLALMCYVDGRMGLMLRDFIDGVPLELASRLLPYRTRLRLSLLIHIHVHARSQKRHSATTSQSFVAEAKMRPHSMEGLIENLSDGIRRLRWRSSPAVWSGYYEDHSYSDESARDKIALVSEFLDRTGARTAWDLGANTGLFSRIASEKGMHTVAWDMEPECVERNYHEVVRENKTNLLPLVVNLSNPSPAIGWDGAERMSFHQRANPDVVLALALVHHLAISNSVPLDMLAKSLSAMCRWLIVEFVPKEDPMVQRLLAVREDIFSDYSQTGFENAFSRWFTFRASRRLQDSVRILYLMERREGAA